MSGVVVAGVGLHPFGRFDGVSTTDMGVVAVRAALREAGAGKGSFQAAFVERPTAAWPRATRC